MHYSIRNPLVFVSDIGGVDTLSTANCFAAKLQLLIKNPGQELLGIFCGLLSALFADELTGFQLLGRIALQHLDDGLVSIQEGVEVELILLDINYQSGT